MQTSVYNRLIKVGFAPLVGLLIAACTQNAPSGLATAVPPIANDTAITSGASSPVAEQSAEQVAEAVEAPTTNENTTPLAATVNDQPIYLDMFEKQVAQFEQSLAAQGVDLSTESGQAQLDQIKGQVLNALIDQAIIEQEAAKFSIVVSDETVEAATQESIEQGQVQFEDWLANNNLTLEEFKETLRFQLVANQMYEQLTANLPDVAEQVQLRQIVVADENTARDVIDRLKAGQDFAELAATYSLDESNRDNGGLLGWFPRNAGLVPPEVEALAFSINPNEVSGPVKTVLGFHIIQLENKEAERPIEAEMLQALREKLFTDWLTERRAASKIERFVAS
ncbi:MAG: peptidylprolyl isomerase [Anaerolineae bacterium]|nr:peptidylprolyl isomerase [Anaerolineae bacterium]